MSKQRGILSRIKAHLDRNRLGEILVLRGLLTPQQLKAALAQQSKEKRPLGEILIDAGLIKAVDLRTTIATQFAFRTMAALVTIMISSSFFQVKQASADTLKPVAAKTAFTSVSFGPVGSYPDLFGTGEKRSSDLSAFTKWNSMFARFDSQMNSSKSPEIVAKWKADLETMRGLPLDQMVERVNTMANRVRYINDNKNWGKSDYWETPIEFFSNGGDCEDFAIAKYASLRALGVPDSRMRILILKDMQKGIPHAILIVYTDNGPVLLDNQIKTVKAVSDVDHYKPIFSINRTAWWLHTPSRNTVMASR